MTTPPFDGDEDYSDILLTPAQATRLSDLNKRIVAGETGDPILSETIAILVELGFKVRPMRGVSIN
jgi:hypothetical protein